MGLYKYSQIEVKKILKFYSSLVVLIDSRKKENRHIVQYLESENIPFSVQKLDVGDYSCMITKNSELAIMRDLHVPVAIERKSTMDELIGNFLAERRIAFQNELIRSKEIDFVLLIEQVTGYSALF